MSPVDDTLNLIVVAGSARATQAKYDREAFAREKRGYASRLREMFDGVELPFTMHDQVRMLIHDLERRDEPAPLTDDERREYVEEKALLERLTASQRREGDDV